MKTQKILLPMILLSFGSANAVTVFTDRGTWQAATSSADLTLDEFDTNITNAATITFDSGVISAGITPLGVPINGVVASGNGYEAIIGDPTVGAGFSEIVWTFPTAINTFGIDLTIFQLLLGNENLRITADFDGAGPESLDLVTDFGFGGTTSTPAFFGVVAEDVFTQLTFSATPNPGGAIFFTSQDLTFGSIPEPSSTLLLSSVVAGCFLRRRK